ncbi:MAG: hypothetical protein R3C68_17420 [Myxococcota bacterium]
MLRDELANARFRHTSAVAVGPRTWEFEFEVSSPIGFVSMPLALRIAGDAAIVAALLDAGEQAKSYPVWGTDLVVSGQVQISSDAPVVVRIELSSVAHEGLGSGIRRQTARFSINGNAATGTFALVLGRRTANPALSSPQLAEPSVTTQSNATGPWLVNTGDAQPIVN